MIQQFLRNLAECSGAKDMEKIDMDYFIEKAPIGFKSSNFTKCRVEKDFFEILPDAKL